MTVDDTTDQETTRTGEQQAGSQAVVIDRRRLDMILIGVGAVLTLALVVAGALLTWGSQFAADYVEDELSSQNITFPPAEALEADGRSDLVKYAGEDVRTGEHAEAYASFIEGHIQNIAGGQTYADLGGVEREAAAAIEEAEAGAANPDQIAALEAEAEQVSAQRDTLFKGETLRGLLLTAYAWATVGQIAGYAAIGAFVAAALMLVLVVLGILRQRSMDRAG
jgi:hypothetical protein